MKKVLNNAKKRGATMLGALLGGAAADYAEDLLIEHTPIDNSGIENGIIAALGAVVVALPKNDGIVTGIGYGMLGKAGSGLKDFAMESFGKDAATKPAKSGKVGDPASPQLSMADVPTEMITVAGSGINDPASPDYSMAGSGIYEQVSGIDSEDIGRPYGMEGNESNPY